MDRWTRALLGFASVCAVATFPALSVHARQAQTTSVTNVRIDVPAVPPEKGGWALELTTHSGVLGATRRTVVDSAGAMVCTPGCDRVRRPSIAALTQEVRLAQASAWTGVRLASVCSDCPVTKLSLWHRDGNGVVQLLMVQWDTLSAGSVDPRIRALYDRVASLTRE